VPGSFCLPQWPAGRKYISIKEAAKLLEPLCPVAPLSERHKAAAERGRPLALEESERRRLLHKAAIEGDFETHRSLSIAPEHQWDDTIYDDVTTSFRQVASLPKYLLALARSIGVDLIDPTLGIVSLTEPDEDLFVNEEGFRKIAKALWRLIQTAAVTPEPKKGKPGPKSLVREAIAGRMFAELPDERRTVEDLSEDTLEALVTAYGGSPNTANLAREDAIARFSEFQKAHNSEKR
jgi:hypothetical protein